MYIEYSSSRATFFFQYYRRSTAATSLDLNKIFKCIIHQWSAVYNDNSRNLLGGSFPIR